MSLPLMLWKKQLIALIKSTYYGSKALSFLKKILIFFHLKKRHLICTIPLIKIKESNKLYDVLSIKEWCESKELSYRVVNTEKKLTIHTPKVYCTDHSDYSCFRGEGILPEIYLAKLKNVIVIEGVDLIITDTEKVLYDEIAFDEDGKYELRHAVKPLIIERHVNNKQISLNFKKNLSTLPKTAIHFCKDYSCNYFHWLIEALPRMWLIDQFPELDSIPLLVDNHSINGSLITQHMEALQILNRGKREIIQLKTGEGYYIENLIYPSPLSLIHNNYFHPITSDKDILISPTAIQYLRDKFLPKKLELPNKKIFISRKNMSIKRLSNYEEIEDFFSHLGFDIVYPEALSFIEQVNLFSQAEIIVAPGGSGCTNFIFAPKSCHVYMLISNNKQLNLNIFNMIATAIGINLYYICGEEQIIDHEMRMLNPFIVDITLIKAALHELI